MSSLSKHQMAPEIHRLGSQGYLRKPRRGDGDEWFQNPKELRVFTQEYEVDRDSSQQIIEHFHNLTPRFTGSSHQHGR